MRTRGWLSASGRTLSPAHAADRLPSPWTHPDRSSNRRPAQRPRAECLTPTLERAVVQLLDAWHPRDAALDALDGSTIRRTRHRPHFPGAGKMCRFGSKRAPKRRFVISGRLEWSPHRKERLPEWKDRIPDRWNQSRDRMVTLDRGREVPSHTKKRLGEVKVWSSGGKNRVHGVWIMRARARAWSRIERERVSRRTDGPNDPAARLSRASM